MSDVGPSYWDVSTYAEDLGLRWACHLQFVVTPPVRVDTTGKYTSWCVTLRAASTPGVYGPVPALVAYYGKGGSWKTLPAAMHDVLRRYDAYRAEQVAAAERRAAF